MGDVFIPVSVPCCEQLLDRRYVRVLCQHSKSQCLRSDIIAFCLAHCICSGLNSVTGTGGAAALSGLKAACTISLIVSSEGGVELLGMYR